MRGFNWLNGFQRMTKKWAERNNHRNDERNFTRVNRRFWFSDVLAYELVSIILGQLSSCFESTNSWVGEKVNLVEDEKNNATHKCEQLEQT